MTKMAKILALLLIFSALMACAFKLALPKPPCKMLVEAVVQPENSTAGQTTQFVPAQEAQTERSLLPVSQAIGSSSPDVAMPPDVATNEEDVLSRIRSWARTDPESTLAWGQQQPEGMERNEALADACFQIAQSDPIRAVTLAEKFNLSKDAVLENLAQQWAGKDLTTAYNWVVTQPEDDKRLALATGVAFVWSQKEPVGAAQFVVQQMTAGSAQDEAVMMVLHQWALADPAAADAWVQQFPDGLLRNRALNELAGIATEQSLAKSK